MAKNSTRQVVMLRLTGTRPLMMQADRLANPLDPETIKHKAVAGKRKKTEEDYRWLLESEWRLSMYHDGAAPYVPAVNIEGALRDGGRKHKLGKAIQEGVSVTADRLPLKYEGPRDLNALFGDGRSPFVDVRSVVIQQRRCMRARPLFLRWSCDAEIEFQDDIISLGDLLMVANSAGERCGIGTYRPKFGRFEVEAL